MNSSDKKYDIAISLCKQDVDFAKKYPANIITNTSTIFLMYREKLLSIFL